jgi:hypothetical protein
MTPAVHAARTASRRAMKRRRWGTVVLIFLSAATVACGARSQLAPLERQLNTYGYSMYNPPRADRGPGWVFQILKTHEGRSVPSTVCTNLFPNFKPSRVNLTLPATDWSTTLAVDLGLDFLDGLVPDLIKAKASLKSVSAVAINWQDVSAEELPRDFRFTEAGTRRPISRQCHASLRDLKTHNLLNNSIFVVEQALVSHSMRMSFTADRSAAAGLDGKYQNLIGFKAAVNTKEIGKTTLEITEPRYLGFMAVALLDYVPSTDLAATEAATITGRQIPLATMQRLLE